MNPTRYEPRSLIEQLQHDLDRAWGDTTRGAIFDWTPAVDIRETPEAFVVTADLPGVDAQNIDVTMESGVLTIRGRREHEQRKEGHGYQRLERVSGEFFRRFALPDTADADAITANTKDGVLTLNIPKKPDVQPRRIEVRGH